MLFFQSLRKLTRKWYSYTSRVEIRRCLEQGESINIALYQDDWYRSESSVLNNDTEHDNAQNITVRIIDEARRCSLVNIDN